MPVRHRIAGITAAGALTIVALTSPAQTVSAVASPVGATAKAPATHLIDVGSNPYDVAISQNMGKAFVVNDGSVSVISLLTHRALGEYGTGNGHGQNAIALMQSNTQAYITDNISTAVTVFDTETHKVIKHITVGYGAVDVVKANTPKGQRAYIVTAVDSAPEHSGVRNQLIGIQTSTGKVVSHTKLPGESATLAVAPGGKSVWVGNEVDGHLYKVSTTSGKIVKTVKPSKAGPVNGLAFAPGGKTLWVAGLGGVSAVSPTSGKTVKYISAGKLAPGFVVPNSLAVNGSGQDVFVVNSAFGNPDPQGTVSEISTKTYKVAWHANLGNTPLGIGLDKTRGVAYVPNYDDDTVSYFSVPK